MAALKIYAGFDMVYDRQYTAQKGVRPAAASQLLVAYNNRTGGADWCQPKQLYCFKASLTDSLLAALQGKQLTAVEAYLRFTVTRDKQINTHIMQDDFTVSDNGDSAYVKCGDNAHSLGITGKHANMRTESADAKQIKNLLLHGLAVSSVDYGINPQIQYTTLNTVASPEAYRPYFLVEYTSPMLTAKDCVPSSGFVNEKQANTFSWAVAYDAERVLGAAQQAKFRLQWRVKGASGYSEVTGGAQNSVTIPANTFSGGAIEWRVILAAQGGADGEPSPWYALTTTDELSAPAALYPKSLTMDGTKAITFTWQHVISTGAAQTRYDLQYSTDGGFTWLALASESTGRMSYAAPAGKFGAGTLFWRVRTYNTDGAAGGWSTAVSFIVRSAPTAAITGYDNKPRPTIRWQAAGQQAYRVTAGAYDSGLMYGTAKSFTLPVYLPDGKTAVTLTVRNAFGIDSQPARAEITVANIGGEAITLCSRGVKNGVGLTWRTGGAYIKYYIYRDGVLIGKTAANSYDDLLTNGKHIYRVRGVTSGDYYTLSNEVTDITRCDSGAVASLQSPAEWLTLKLRRGASPTYSVAREQNITYQYYSGRALPVGEADGTRTATHTFGYTLLSRTDVARLEALAGQMVIFKNNRGDTAIGILSTIAEEKTRTTDVSFVITEVDAGAASYDV